MDASHISEPPDLQEEPIARRRPWSPPELRVERTNQTSTVKGFSSPIERLFSGPPS